MWPIKHKHEHALHTVETRQRETVHVNQAISIIIITNYTTLNTKILILLLLLISTNAITLK